MDTPMCHPWLRNLNPGVSKKLLGPDDFSFRRRSCGSLYLCGEVLQGFWRCVDSLTDPSLHSDTFGPNARGLLHGP
jgi:hypothetical protein